MVLLNQRNTLKELILKINYVQTLNPLTNTLNLANFIQAIVLCIVQVINY